MQKEIKEKFMGFGKVTGYDVYLGPLTGQGRRKLCRILDYLDEHTVAKLQVLSRYAYEQVVPEYMH